VPGGAAGRHVPLGGRRARLHPGPGAGRDPGGAHQGPAARALGPPERGDRGGAPGGRAPRPGVVPPGPGRRLDSRHSLEVLMSSAVQARGPRPVVKPRRPAGPVWRTADTDPRLESLLDPTSFDAAEYRLLRYRVEKMRRLRGVSVAAVTSPSIGDGKTTTAINLAGSLAQAPRTRVLLVDADLRRPSVRTRLGLSES